MPNGSSTRANHIVIRVLPAGALKGDIAAAGFYTGSWNREVRRAAAGGAGGPARRGALDGHEEPARWRKATLDNVFLPDRE